MEDLKAQIKQKSSQAAQLSQEAMVAFADRDFQKGKALMQQATEAGKNCQNLIARYQQSEVTAS